MQERTSIPSAARIHGALLLPAILYTAIALWMGLDSAGLQYDEAIYQHGAVEMVEPLSRPDFVREPESWIRVGDREMPLMVISYAGAAKFYILAPLFALFGPSLFVGRIVSLLLGCAGVWGISFAIARLTTLRCGAAVGLALALNPNYVGWTIYDNAGTALWMATLGALAVAVALYAKSPNRGRAALVGAVLGFAVWGRVNFLWVATGLLIGGLLFLRREIAKRARDLPLFLVGAVAGGLPLLVFELRSRFATLDFLKSAGPARPWPELLSRRTYFAASSLLYDDERRGMWGAASMADGSLLWLIAAIVLVSVAVSLLLRERTHYVLVARVSGVALLVALLFAFFTPLEVNAHHFAAITVPLGAVNVVATGAAVASRSRTAVIVVASLALFYAVVASAVNVQAEEGLETSHGRGMWSDAIDRVANESSRRAAGRTLQIVDWGLGNNLYVLTGGRLRMKELFWGADQNRSGYGPWRDVVSRGGLFVVNAPENTHFAAAALGFRRALTESGVRYTRIAIREKSGRPYAEIFDVEPAQREPSRRIKRVVPDSTRVATGFNPLQNGDSGLSVVGSGFVAGDSIWLEGVPLPTTFGNGGWLTAAAPPRSWATPGVKSLEVRSADGRVVAKARFTVVP